MKSITIVLVCAMSGTALAAKEKPPTTYTIPLPPRPDFTFLEWMVGEWMGKTEGRGPKGEVRLAVTFSLEKRFMILKEDIALEATKTAPATRVSWLGILSANPSGSGFALRVFSSTGFITRYRVTVEGPEIHFYPEGGEQPPPGWLFRRTVRRMTESELEETVQAAPPDGAFFDYYTARLVRSTTP